MRAFLAWLVFAVYTYLVPVANVALLVSVFVLLPLGALRRTRPLAGILLFAASYVFGVTAWCLGAGVSFTSFGWIGLVIGLLLFGAGVVFVGMVGAVTRLDQPAIAMSLLILSIAAFATRFVGAMFMRPQ